MSPYKYTSIRILIGGSLNLSWSDILKLSHVFPNLEELRVPNNNVKRLDTPVDNNFKSLMVLDLENNPIGEWNEILKLQVMVNLEQLSLENTGLKHIKFEESPQTTAFANLKKLVLTNNLLNDVSNFASLIIMLKHHSMYQNYVDGSVSNYV